VNAAAQEVVSELVRGDTSHRLRGQSLADDDRL
jgi:hypothetical protein